MKESRTSKVLRKRFARGNREKGFVGGSMQIEHNNIREDLKNEAKVRYEIQNTIMNMVQNKRTIDEIRKFLSQDKFKAYEQYFEVWIQNWVIKSSKDLKSIIEKACKKNKSQEEIIQELESSNNEVYKLYKNEINDYVKNEIEARKRKLLQEELKQQKLNKQEEER